MNPRWSIMIVVAVAGSVAAALDCGNKYGDSALPSVDAGPCGATYDNQIKAILDGNCVGCHGGGGGRGGVSLDTYDNAAQNADRAFQAASSGRMPPSGSLTDQDVALLKAWIDGGKQQHCAAGGGDGGGGQIQLTCTSGAYFSGGEEGGASMSPGADCLACHGGGGEVAGFAAAGTVFGAYHDKNDCVGVAGIQVELTAADGIVTPMTTNDTGNFYLTGAAGSIKTPFTARVVMGGHERRMKTAQTLTSCNACHTAEGNQGAPGRIVAP